MTKKKGLPTAIANRPAQICWKKWSMKEKRLADHRQPCARLRRDRHSDISGHYGVRPTQGDRDFEEYRYLRDNFEELTGTLSWLPIINLQLARLRSFRRKRRPDLDTSPVVPPEMMECTAILNHVGKQDDQHQDQLAHERRTQSLN